MLICRRSTGEIELVWFQGINWINDKLKPGIEYIVFGKPTRFGNKFNIAHPEIDLVRKKTSKRGFLQPVYSVTEKFRVKHFDSKALSKFIQELLNHSADKIRETLPSPMMLLRNLISKKDALYNIHMPESMNCLPEPSTV